VDSERALFLAGCGIYIFTLLIVFFPVYMLLGLIESFLSSCTTVVFISYVKKSLRIKSRSFIDCCFWELYSFNQFTVRSLVNFLVTFLHITLYESIFPITIY
jgi:hypothetical protein